MDAEIEEAFAFYLRLKYHLTPGDVEPTKTPGYWRIKTPCGGRAGGCRNALHGTVFNEGPTHHTVRYTDGCLDSLGRRTRSRHGRFISPYRTWRYYRERTDAAPTLREQEG